MKARDLAGRVGSIELLGVLGLVLLGSSFPEYCVSYGNRDQPDYEDFGQSQNGVVDKAEDLQLAASGFLDSASVAGVDQEPLHGRPEDDQRQCAWGDSKAGVSAADKKLGRN